MCKIEQNSKAKKVYKLQGAEYKLYNTSLLRSYYSKNKFLLKINMHIYNPWQLISK
jgi:hypothetical protein